MNFNSFLGHQTPPPQSSCRRQNAWVNTKAGETKPSKLPKDARRRGQDLRRIRSVSQAKSDAESSSSSDNDVCLKKKREQIPKEISEGTSADLEPEDAAVTVGSRGSESCRPYGKISVVGRRREMEDVVAVELGFLKRGERSYDFFGVYDENGWRRVAHACGLVLHTMLAKIVEEESGEEIDWEAVIAVGFKMMEAEVNKKGAVAAAMLSSAVIAVVGENEVVVANCGGARAVLSSGGVAVQLLEDHKPVLEKVEVRREDALNWKGQKIPPASPRALEPKIRVMRRSHADEFLILGSDGLWDVIPDEFACQVARRFCEGAGKRRDGGGEGDERDGAVAAAALMAELAVARGSKDNISVIVVDLKDCSKFG